MVVEQAKLQACLDQKLEEIGIFKPDELRLKGDPSSLDASIKLRKAIQELSGKPSYESTQKVRELMASYPPGINFLPSQTVHERVGVHAKMAHAVAKSDKRGATAARASRCYTFTIRIRARIINTASTTR